MGVSLAFLALAPLATAHVDDVPNRAVWSFGPFIAVLTAEGVPYAGQPMNWSLEILTGAGTFQPPAGTGVTLTASQDDAVVAIAVHPGAHGGWHANWTAPQHGAWNVTVEVSGPARGKGSDSIMVYPDLGYRILASTTNPTTNTLNRIAFRSEPAGQDVADLRLQLEPWKPGTLAGPVAATVPLVRDGPGRWHAAVDFSAVGVYHVVLSSATFGAGEMPAQRFEVTAGPERTGLDGHGWIVSAVVVSIVVWLGIAARRPR